MASSINATTFTLKKKGSAGTISASITYVPETRTAILDPSVERLRSGATYVAKVTQAAKDQAGIALDQNTNTEVDEPKTWSFRVR